MTYLPSLVPIGPVDCEKQIVMLKSNGHKSDDNTYLSSNEI